MKLTPFRICCGAIFFVGLFSCNNSGVDSEHKSLDTAVQLSENEIPVFEDREVFFGNLHVHTNWSFDGYANGSVTGPEEAYRWAQGESIPGGGGGGDIRVKVPLDWYAVSDHAEYLGVFPMMEDTTTAVSKTAVAKKATSKDPLVSFEAYKEVLALISSGTKDPVLADLQIQKTVWERLVNITEKYNQPGRFTTFPAFEWTSNPSQQNLHRVVLFRDLKALPEVPFSAVDSDREEDLWKWMDDKRNKGATLLAVPHNGNASNGLMFSASRSYGGSDVRDSAYVLARMRNEPLYEITQIKGTSETHPLLSPNDEFAGFELWDYTLSADAKPPKKKAGGYVRDALKQGIKQDAEGKGNPFKYGFIGDGDSHNSATPLEEDNYTGKFGVENNPEHRLNGVPGTPDGNKKQVREFSSAGVAGVWAESNTRESLFAAMERKETFATSGTRMKLRVFASFDYSPDIMKNSTWVQNAYRTGVPMGGDLFASEKGKVPVFLIRAEKEKNGANLDRVQVVKGWTKNRKVYEKIYDVLWSGDRKPGKNGKLPELGNTVNAKEATYSNTIGSELLSGVWVDPEFDPSLHAFYYVRVLEIPTPRWSTYDAKKLGIAPRKDLPVSIQERAWSSPIWYRPIPKIKKN